MREIIILECTECKRRNYTTTKEKKNTPTQLLMIEFFKNLTAGQSKRAAFLAAQQTVRAKYPNPLYWAAFVMVDGN